MSLTSPWRINLLGGLWAVREEQEFERFRRGVEARLLSFLAFHREQKHAREQLAEWLWPDATTGRGNLRVALNSLRRRLEPPGTPRNSVLVADRILVYLNPALVTTDVGEFERVIRAARPVSADRVGHMKRAVALYRGPLLPGNLDDWARDARDRLALAYRQALGDLAQELAVRGDHSGAVEYALRAVEADPLYEEAYLTLMRLLAHQGRAPEALKQYVKLRCRLRRDSGGTPSSEARLLARRLRADPESFTASTPLPPLCPETGTPDGSPATSSPHLPMSTTRFFGREEEVDRILAMFSRDRCRLVTLSGPGGSGKTRLAVECAWRTPQAGAGRAWYVPLADLAGAGYVPRAILDATGEKPEADSDPLDSAAAALSGAPALLVLDNFEHLVDDGAAILLALLERVPYLSCLVTSRRLLGLTGERVVDVPPLPVPEPEDALERLAAQPSVRLFVDRAQAKAPEFQVTAGNRQAVAGLVRGLEGIPLALEMAAAWLPVRTPARMAAELADRYGLLTRNARGVPGRHRTLRAAVEWSHDLLSPPARAFLADLAVFRGGWELASAEAVCREPQAAGLLAELREHSWVLADGEGRFRMLETLREFAAASLDGVPRAELAGRHARYFSAWLAGGEAAADAGQERQALEHDNLRAALDWCIGAGGQAELALSIARHSGRFWHARGHLAEGRRWLEAALDASAGSPPAERADALRWAGILSAVQGEYGTAVIRFEEARDLLGEAGDAALLGSILNGLGNAHMGRAEYAQARAALERSAAVYRQEGQPLPLAQALMNLGNLAEKQGDYDVAERRHAEALATRLAARHDPRWAHLYAAIDRDIAMSRMNMGNLALARGEYALARGMYAESFRWHEAQGDRYSMAATRHNLGAAALFAGDDGRARDCFRESAAWRADLGDRAGLASSLCQTALLDWRGDDLPAAIRGVVESLGVAWEIGERETAAECLALARLLAGRYRRFGWAARLWGVHDRLLADAGLRDLVAPQERAADDALEAAGRGALGAETFDGLRAAGRGGMLAPAVEEVLTGLPLLPHMRQKGDPSGR